MKTDHGVWRILLPGDAGLLELAPRWWQFAETWQSAAFVAASLVPLVLILALYRFELRLLRRSTAGLLLGLRILFFLILWFLICLQPVLAHVRSERLPSRVTAAVDVSQSMATADPQRGHAEKLRLVRALRLCDVETTAPLDAWITHHERSGADKPIFANERERSEYERLLQAAGALTRREIVSRILDDPGLKLLDRLAQDHEIELTAFDRLSRKTTLQQLGGVEQRTAGDTDLRTPLKRAAQEKGELLGVILLSDGRHTLDEAVPVDSKTPLYPIVIGAKRPPADLAVVEVKSPGSVFKDADARFEVTLRTVDISAQDLVVELRERGAPTPLETKVVKHDGRAESHTLEFFRPMKEAGMREFEVTVRANAATQEITDKNNTLPALVRVTDDRARVLLIDGEARWEYHYIAAALLRDETIELGRVLFQQPRIGKLSAAEELSHRPRRTLPDVTDGIDPLLDFDCIVLGDVNPDDLPLKDRERLKRYVSERGGTLIVTAGKRYMPLGYTVNADDPLTKLLPINEPKVVTPAAGFTLKFTHAGSATPFLQLDPIPELNTQRWGKMMPHFWGAVGAIKPGAAALAYFDEGTAGAGRVEETQALFALHSYGFGKVLYLGIDSTWRWRYRVGDAYHHRFWGQVARWAAADEMLPAGNHIARFGSRAPVYREGQPVEVLVRLSSETPAPPKDARATARLVLDGKEAARVELTATPAQPRLLQGSVSGLPSGSYRIEVDLPHLKENLDSKHEARVTVSPGPQREFRDLSANAELLDQLARKSGGRLFTPENVEELVDLLARRITIREHRVEQKLWQDTPLVWWVLALLLLLVTLEWSVRKLVGLP